MADPAKPGTTIGGIKTPMMAANIDRQNTPGTKSYPNMPSSSGGGGQIKGPGNQNTWPRK